MRRGEVWWAELPAPAGRRPVLLLSRDEAYLVRELVTVAPLTTRVRKIPSEVPLSRDDGVPKTCVVSLDTITTIPRRAVTVRLPALGGGDRLARDELLAERIDEAPVLRDAIVEVGARREPGGAHVADHLALHDAPAGADAGAQA